MAKVAPAIATMEVAIIKMGLTSPVLGLVGGNSMGSSDGSSGVNVH